MKRVVTAAVFLAFSAGLALAQENPFPRFKQFKNVAPGIDFYASERSQVDPFVKAITETREKIGDFLVNIDAPGAIFICSTLDQKDSIWDLRIFRNGYKWYLPYLTPEVQRAENMARMAQAAAAAGADEQTATSGGRQGRGGQQGRSDSGRGGQGGRQGGQSADFRASAEARAATTLATQMGYAILMSCLDNPKQYRVSRLDDMSRSPLNDWLDIALVAYATGTIQNSFRTLLERVDDTFPLDDVLSMSRPFVASQDASSGGRGGGRGGGSRVLPKDVIDRMVFDAQAGAFFLYVREKAGADKLLDVLQQNLKGVESVDTIQTLFGRNFDQTERDFMAWVKAQKPSEPIAIRMGPDRQTMGLSR